jgi:hypothetical protein
LWKNLETALFVICYLLKAGISLLISAQMESRIVL